jgi:hypothetical protein
MSRKIPDEMELKIVEHYRKFQSITKTATEFGVSTSGIQRVLVRHGVDRTGQKLYYDKIRKLPAAEVLMEDYRKGLFAREIASKYGATYGAVLYALKQAGFQPRIRGRQRDVILDDERKAILAAYNVEQNLKRTGKKLGISAERVTRVLEDEGIDRSAQRKYADQTWRYGLVKTSEGYLSLMLPKDDPMASMRNSTGYVQQHRLVMARSLERPLSRHETVHHINGDKTDNRIENLQLRQGKHGKGTAMICLDCGSHNLGHRKLE